MSTRLQIANQILLNNGQRTLTDTTSTLRGQLVANVMSAALQKLCRDNKWTWTYDRVASSSWSSEVATLDTTVIEVQQAAYYDSTGAFYRPIRFLSPSEFDQYEIESYLYTETTVPRWWTFDDTQYKVRVNPYPNDATARSRVVFYVYKYFTIPATDGASFTIPPDMEDPLVLLASSMYARRHGEDPSLSKMLEDEYHDAVVRIRSRQMVAPGERITVYRGRRNSAHDSIP